MTNYTRGANFERRVAHHLRAYGYDALRTPGSRGPYDVIASRGSADRLVIQCKPDRHTLRPAGWGSLVRAANSLHALPIIADQTGPRRTLRFWLVLGDRPPFASIDEYVTRWHPDVVVDNDVRVTSS